MMNKLRYLTFVFAIFCKTTLSPTVEESVVHGCCLPLYLVTDHETKEPDPRFPAQEFSDAFAKYFYACKDIDDSVGFLPIDLGDCDVERAFYFQGSQYGWAIPEAIAVDLKQYFPEADRNRMHFRLHGQRILVFFGPSFVVSNYGEEKYLVPLSSNNRSITLFDIQGANPELRSGAVLNDEEASNLMLRNGHLQPLSIAGDYILSAAEEHVEDDQGKFRLIFGNRRIMFDQMPRAFSLQKTVELIKFFRQYANDRIIPEASVGSVKIVHLAGFNFSGCKNYWIVIYDRVKRCIVVFIGETHPLRVRLTQDGFIGNELSKKKIAALNRILERN